MRISVEGNIAAGKSTFLRILCERKLNFILVPEVTPARRCIDSRPAQSPDAPPL